MIKLIDILREGMASDKHPTNSNEENFKKLLNRLSDGEKNIMNYYGINLLIIMKNIKFFLE